MAPLRREPITEVTANDKLEEGEDDVKSSCPQCSGPHTCYNGRDKRRQPRGQLEPQTRPQFGSWAATRPREVGIASNRWSATQR